jgi:hypothetical protein
MVSKLQKIRQTCCVIMNETKKSRSAAGFVLKSKTYFFSGAFAAGAAAGAFAAVAGVAASSCFN